MESKKIEWWKSLLIGIGDAVIVTDIGGGIDFMNPSAELLTGWRLKEGLGKKFKEVLKIINEDSEDESEIILSKVLNSEEGKFEIKEYTTAIVKDEIKKVIAGNGSVFCNSDGKLEGVIWLFRDVSLKKDREQDILKRQSFSLMGSLARGIAHDFSNILTELFGNVSLAKLYAKEDDKVFDKLKQVEVVFKKAEDLISKLQSFYQRKGVLKEEVNVEELIREIVSYRKSKSNFEPVLSIKNDLGKVKINPDRMRQVINSCLQNAEEAMSGENVLEVSAENVVINEAQYSSLVNGKYIKIEIKDQGCGILKEDLDTIFEPYFTTKKAKGFGLSTAYAIICSNKGKIEVNSKVGQGTTVTLFFPAID